MEEGEVCSYLLQHLRERDTLAHTSPLPFQGPPSLRHNSYSRVQHMSCKCVSSSCDQSSSVVAGDALQDHVCP